MMGWIQTLLTAIFPHHCFLCNTVILPRQRLCADCADKAAYILPPVCERCGRNVDRCCCGKHSRHFERCVSPFYHDGVVQNGISQLKNHNDRVTADGFATEMAEVIRREYGGIAFDAVTSVPLHKKDLRRRGFDQAASLAKALGGDIPGLREFPAFPGPVEVPSTPGQLWCWVRGDDVGDLPAFAALDRLLHRHGFADGKARGLRSAQFCHAAAAGKRRADIVAERADIGPLGAEDAKLYFAR